MDSLTKQLEALRRQHADTCPEQPMSYSDELIDRIVDYTRKQQKKGIPSSTTSDRLKIPHGRLHYWLYHRGRKLRPAPAAHPLTLRPVEISSEVHSAPDGRRQALFTVRSPSGWQVSDLTLEQLSQLLRSLM